MILRAFSVYDEKSGAYAHPFFCSAIGVATRMVDDWVSDSRTSISRHPGDYKLYDVGEFDDASGMFKASQPAFIANVTDFVRKENVHEFEREAGK